MDLATKRYTSINYISGPLLFVEGARDLSYGAIVEIHVQDGSVRGGQVIEVSDRNAVIQVFEETRGMDLAKTSLSLREDVANKEEELKQAKRQLQKLEEARKVLETA